jgi:CrcB protein
MNYVYVIMGGGIGALARYFSSRFINALGTGKFPLGTLFVNGGGALLIGFLIPVLDVFSIPTKWRLLLVTGFLGGYTTFSTYSLETAQYFIDGNIKGALVNIVLHNVLSILLVLLGMWLSRALFTK